MITLDSREMQLISLMKSRDLDKYASFINIESKQLDIGDIHITFAGKSWIFERKTVNDLMASIKDGRYREQKARLISTGLDITYIIEGDDIVSSKYERYQPLLSGAYLHTMYRDNIRIVFTKSTNDTCTFLLTLCTKIIDKPDEFITKQDTEYIQCLKLKTKKIDNITPDLCYLMQLSQIPSISTVIAKNIQETYNTMPALISALNASDDKMNTLCKIDKIGKEKAAKILEYLGML